MYGDHSGYSNHLHSHQRQQQFYGRGDMTAAAPHSSRRHHSQHHSQIPVHQNAYADPIYGQQAYFSQQQQQQSAQNGQSEDDARYLFELLDGDSDWMNIQPVIRMTMRMTGDLLRRQNAQIKNLTSEVQRLSAQQKQTQEALSCKSEEASLKQAVENLDQKIQHAQKQHDSKLSQVESKLTEAVTKKIDMDTFTSALAQRVDVVDFYNALKLKANATDVIQRMDERADSLMSDLLHMMDKKNNDLQGQVQVQITDRLQQQEKLFTRRQDFEFQLASLRDMLDIKVSKDELLRMLDSKSDKTDISRMSSSVHSAVQEAKDLRDQVTLHSKAIDAQCSEQSTRAKILGDSITRLEDGMTRLAEQIANVDYGSNNRCKDLSVRVEARDNEWKLKWRELEAITAKVSNQVHEIRDSVLRDFAQKVDDETIGLRNYMLQQIDDLREVLKIKIEKAEVRELVDQKLEIIINNFSDRTESIITEQQTELQKSNSKLKEQLEKSKESMDRMKEQVELLANYVNLKANKADIDREVQKVINRIQVQIDEEKQERDAADDSLLRQLQDMHKRTKQLESDLDSGLEGIARLQNDKADLSSFNQWIQSHNKEVNAVLDKKCSFEDLDKARQMVSLLQAQMSEQFSQVDRELSEQRIIKTKLDDFLQQMAEHYISRVQLEEVAQRLRVAIEKQGSENEHAYTESRNSIDRITRQLGDKVDKAEFKREINQLESGKTSRKDFEAKKKSDMESYSDLVDKLQQALTLKREFQDFKDTIRQDLKTEINSKCSMKDVNNLLHMHYLAKSELELFVDRRLVSYKQVIEDIQRKITSGNITSNSLRSSLGAARASQIIADAVDPNMTQRSPGDSQVNTSGLVDEWALESSFSLRDSKPPMAPTSSLTEKALQMDADVAPLLSRSHHGPQSQNTSYKPARASKSVL